MIYPTDIVKTARSYIGTPFHHRERQPGVALDCVGLLVCAARELGIYPPDFDVPRYTPHPDGKTMLALCREFMTEVPQERMQLGDAVAVFINDRPQHLGIAGDYRNNHFSIIHASNDQRLMRVVEMRLMFSKHFRFAGAFRFPGVT